MTAALERLRQWFWTIRVPLAVFFASRISLFLLAYAALMMLPTRSGPGLWRAFPNNPWLDGWSRWDSGWYIKIVESGYGYQTFGESNVAFFPLYPLTIKALQWLIPSPHVAGILLSNLYFMVALVLFHRLTERKLGGEAAQWATLFFAFFPFAFFFSAVYTEALFVLLAVAAFFFAERRQWLLASLAGMLCSATRLVGLSLFPALAVLYWQQWRSPKKEPLANAIYLSLIPAGLGAYMIFLQQRFGEPFAFLKANEAGWGARFSLEFPLHRDFWDFLTQILPTQGFRGDYDFGLLVNVVVTILFLVALYPVARRVGLSYAVFAFFALAIPFSSALISLGRFAAVVFPVFMVAGDLLRGRPLLAQSVLMLSGLFLGLFTALFVNWYWMI